MGRTEERKRTYIQISTEIFRQYNERVEEYAKLIGKPKSWILRQALVQYMDRNYPYESEL